MYRFRLIAGSRFAYNKENESRGPVSVMVNMGLHVMLGFAPVYDGRRSSVRMYRYFFQRITDIDTSTAWPVVCTTPSTVKPLKRVGVTLSHLERFNRLQTMSSNPVNALERPLLQQHAPHAHPCEVLRPRKRQATPLPFFLNVLFHDGFNSIELRNAVAGNLRCIQLPRKSMSVDRKDSSPFYPREVCCLSPFPQPLWALLRQSHATEPPTHSQTPLTG